MKINDDIASTFNMHLDYYNWALRLEDDNRSKWKSIIIEFMKFLTKRTLSFPVGSLIYRDSFEELIKLHNLIANVRSKF